MVREDLSEEVIFELRPESPEGESYANILGRRITWRKKRQQVTRPWGRGAPTVHEEQQGANVAGLQ